MEPRKKVSKLVEVGGVLVKIGVGWWNPGMRLVESRWSLVEIEFGGDRCEIGGV